MLGRLQAAPHILGCRFSSDKANRWRDVVPIPGNIPYHGELYPYSGRRRHAKVHVLHQQSTEGHGNPVLEDGKGRLRSPNLGLIAPALLQGILHHYPNGLAPKINPIIAGHLREDHEVGGRVQRVRDPLLPMTFHQSLCQREEDKEKR